MGVTNASKIEDDLALKMIDQFPTPVMSVNRKMEMTFLNRAGLKLLDKSWEEVKNHPCKEVFNSAHCGTPECRMQNVMEGAEPCSVRNELNVNGRTIPIEYMAAVLKDKDGNIAGGVEYFQDVTEKVVQEKRLREQSRTIMEISTPAIKLWDRILVLPVVGVVDSLRAQQMMNTMLEKIMETAARVIILDIQGVAAVDTAVANHLIKIAKATKLMGCRCIISGISPAVAQTLVELGIELDEILTNSTLQDALADAFSIVNLMVTEEKQA